MAVKIADTLGRLGKGFWIINAKDAGLSDGRDVETVLIEVEALAKGKGNGYVFDTTSDMLASLNDEEFVANLNLGDNLYIRETDVPDYWWDGTQVQMLETQKLDLDNLATEATEQDLKEAFEV